MKELKTIEEVDALCKFILDLRDCPRFYSGGGNVERFLIRSVSYVLENDTKEDLPKENKWRYSNWDDETEVGNKCSLIKFLIQCAKNTDIELFDRWENTFVKFPSGNLSFPSNTDILDLITEVADTSNKDIEYLFDNIHFWYNLQTKNLTNETRQTDTKD